MTINILSSILSSGLARIYKMSKANELASFSCMRLADTRHTDFVMIARTDMAVNDVKATGER